MNTLKVKRLRSDAILPKYQTAGAACFDLHAIYIDKDPAFASKDSKTLGTGLAFEVPDGYVMLVFSRSGHGFKHNVRLANCVGVIDSDYRGELRIKLTVDSDSAPLPINMGDRVAQALLIPVNQWRIEETGSLTPTARGDGAYGSTGMAAEHPGVADAFQFAP